MKIKFNEVSKENPFSMVREENNHIEQSSECDEDIVFSGKDNDNIKSKISIIPSNSRLYTKNTKNKLFGGILRFSDQTQSLVNLKSQRENEKQENAKRSPFKGLTDFQQVILARDASENKKDIGNSQLGNLNGRDRKGKSQTQVIKNKQDERLRSSELLNNQNIYLNDYQLNKLKNQQTNIDVLQPSERLTSNINFKQESKKEYSDKIVSRSRSRSKSQTSFLNDYEEPAGIKSDFLKNQGRNFASKSHVNNQKASQFENQFNIFSENQQFNKKSDLQQFDSYSDKDYNINIQQVKIPPSLSQRLGSTQKIQKNSQVHFQNDQIFEEKTQSYDRNKLQATNENKSTSLFCQDNQNNQLPQSSQIINLSFENQNKTRQSYPVQKQPQKFDAIEDAILNHHQEQEVTILMQKSNLNSQNYLPKKTIFYTVLQEPIYGKVSQEVLRNFSRQSVLKIEEKIGLNNQKLQVFNKNPEYQNSFKLQKQLQNIDYDNYLQDYDQYEENQFSTEFRILNKSAQVIQKYLRGYLIRQKSKLLLKMLQVVGKYHNIKKQKIIQNLKQSMAMSTQYLQNKKYTMLNSYITYCAIKIQAAFRGHYQRKFIVAFRKSFKSIQGFLKFNAILKGWRTRKIFKLKVVQTKIANIKDHDQNLIQDLYEPNKIKQSRQILINKLNLLLTNLLSFDDRWLMIQRNELNASNVVTKKKQIKNKILEKNKSKRDSKSIPEQTVKNQEKLSRNKEDIRSRKIEKKNKQQNVLQQKSEQISIQSIKAKEEGNIQKSQKISLRNINQKQDNQTRQKMQFTKIEETNMNEQETYEKQCKIFEGGQSTFQSRSSSLQITLKNQIYPSKENVLKLEDKSNFQQKSSRKIKIENIIKQIEKDEDIKPRDFDVQYSQFNQSSMLNTELSLVLEEKDIIQKKILQPKEQKLSLVKNFNAIDKSKIIQTSNLIQKKPQKIIQIEDEKIIEVQQQQDFGQSEFNVNKQNPFLKQLSLKNKKSLSIVPQEQIEKQENKKEQIKEQKIENVESDYVNLNQIQVFRKSHRRIESESIIQTKQVQSPQSKLFQSQIFKENSQSPSDQKNLEQLNQNYNLSNEIEIELQSLKKSDISQNLQASRNVLNINQIIQNNEKIFENQELSIDSNEDFTIQKSQQYEFKTKVGKQHHESITTEISYIKVIEDEGSQLQKEMFNQKIELRKSKINDIDNRIQKLRSSIANNKAFESNAPVSQDCNSKQYDLIDRQTIQLKDSSFDVENLSLIDNNQVQSNTIQINQQQSRTDQQLDFKIQLQQTQVYTTEEYDSKNSYKQPSKQSQQVSNYQDSQKKDSNENENSFNDQQQINENEEIDDEEINEFSQIHDNSNNSDQVYQISPISSNHKDMSQFKQQKELNPYFNNEANRASRVETQGRKQSLLYKNLNQKQNVHEYFNESIQKVSTLTQEKERMQTNEAGMYMHKKNNSDFTLGKQSMQQSHDEINISIEIKEIETLPALSTIQYQETLQVTNKLISLEEISQFSKQNSIKNHNFNQIKQSKALNQFNVPERNSKILNPSFIQQMDPLIKSKAEQIQEIDEDKDNEQTSLDSIQQILEIDDSLPNNLKARTFSLYSNQVQNKKNKSMLKFEQPQVLKQNYINDQMTQKQIDNTVLEASSSTSSEVSNIILQQEWQFDKHDENLQQIIEKIQNLDQQESLKSNSLIQNESNQLDYYQNQDNNQKKQSQPLHSTTNNQSTKLFSANSKSNESATDLSQNIQTVQKIVSNELDYSNKYLDQIVVNVQYQNHSNQNQEKRRTQFHNLNRQIRMVQNPERLNDFEEQLNQKQNLTRNKSASILIQDQKKKQNNITQEQKIPKKSNVQINMFLKKNTEEKQQTSKKSFINTLKKQSFLKTSKLVQNSNYQEAKKAFDFEKDVKKINLSRKQSSLLPQNQEQIKYKSKQESNRNSQIQKTAHGFIDLYKYVSFGSKPNNKESKLESAQNFEQKAGFSANSFINLKSSSNRNHSSNKNSTPRQTSREFYENKHGLIQCFVAQNSGETIQQIEAIKTRFNKRHSKTSNNTNEK